MAGALRNYLFFGYKRIMQQAPYFAIPFALGAFSLSRRTVVWILTSITAIILLRLRDLQLGSFAQRVFELQGGSPSAWW